jgi:hypothetical protein
LPASTEACTCARVVEGKLAEVSLQLVYPPGALPQIIDTLRSRLGPLTNDPDNKHRWRTKQLVLEAGELDDFGELTIAHAP